MTNLVKHVVCLIATVVAVVDAFGRLVVHPNHHVTLLPRSSRRSYLSSLFMAGATCEEIDNLFAQAQPDKARALLQESDDYLSNDELYWRYVKSFFESFASISADDSKKALQEDLLRQGIEAAEKGLEQSSFPNNGYLLKWKAVLLGKLGAYQKTKDKMANSFIIKEDLQAALQQLPEDGSIRQALGEWCFKVAGISFVERQVASVLFGQPPKSTFDEALEYFEQAFELKQNSETAIKVAETHEKLGNKDKAKEWREKASSLA